MVIPALLVGVQAIRTNGLVRGTLESLGERLARSRTYAEVEDAMFNQTQVIWRYLSGDAAAVLARQELVERLQPALAEVNREIYRRAREFSVQAAFTQVAGIVDAERRVLWGIVGLALAAGLLASWLISRSLARPPT